MNPAFQLEPVGWSRNFESEVFDDEEDLDMTLPPPTFTWKSAEKQHPKLLIVGTQRAASCFLHTVFPKKECCAVLTLPELKPKKFPEKALEFREEMCRVWDIGTPETVLVVTCQYHVAPDRAWEWSQTLLSNIQPQEVVVLDSLLEAHYQTLQSIQMPLLRKLSTNTESSVNFSQIKPLEVPNAVEQVAAALLTLGEIKQLSVTCFVTLRGSFELVPENLKIFENVLSPILSAPTFEKMKAVAQQESSLKAYLEAIRSLPVSHADHIYL